MNRKELIEKYNSSYLSLLKKGIQGKFLLIILLIPATIFGYFFIDYCFYYFKWYKSFPHSILILLVGAVFFIFALAIFLSDSLSYLSSRKVRSLTFAFKNDLYHLIRNELPEIERYDFKKKIHRKTIEASGLFNGRLLDYFGDDWLFGSYGNAKFEICELHVYKSLRKIFSGFFIRFRFPSNPVSQKLEIQEINNSLGGKIVDFENKHKSKILHSTSNFDVYLAVKMNGYFLEIKNKNTIHKLENDIETVKDIVGLIKVFIEFQIEKINHS